MVEGQEEQDAEGKTKKYYLACNFAPTVSIIPRQQSQWNRCSQKLHGPFLRVVLLTTVKRALEQWWPSPRSPPGQHKPLCLCLSSRNARAFHLLQLHRSYHQPWKNSCLSCANIRIIISFYVYELIRVHKLLFFFLEMGHLRINRVYELLEMIR